MDFRSSFVAWFFFTCLTASGQSNLPCFSADKSRGCSPLTVTFIDCSGSPQTPFYIVTLGTEKISNDNTSTLTLTKPGKYAVKQLIGGVNFSESVEITVLDTPEPTFKVHYCEGGKVSLTIDNPVYDLYDVDFGDGQKAENILSGSPDLVHTYTDFNPKTIKLTGKITSAGGCEVSSSQSIVPLTSMTVPFIEEMEFNEQNSRLSYTIYPKTGYKLLRKTLSGTYSVYDSTEPGNSSMASKIWKNNLPMFLNGEFDCYKLIAFDACNKELPSEEICTAYLTINSGDKTEKINWKTSAGIFTTLTLLKNGAEIVKSKSPDSSFIDNDIQCGVDYCYSLKAKTNNGASLTISLPSNCVKGFSSEIPPTITTLNSTIEINQVNLNWIPTINQTLDYEITRTAGSEITKTHAKLLNSYNEPLPGLVKQFCYSVRYKNECGNYSQPGPTTCPTLLQAEQNTDGAIFTWTNYSGYPSPFNYTIEKFDQSQNLLNDTPVTGVNVLKEKTSEGGIFYYRVKISGPGGLVSYSNTLELKNEMSFDIPDAFTPNNDGTNDKFLIYSRFVKDYKLTILNRWGQIVFYTASKENTWDGTIGGLPLPSDSYVYKIEATDYRGISKDVTGTVTLLK